MLGLLFKRKAKSTRFYPTSIAVNLIFGSSPADISASGGGGDGIGGRGQQRQQNSAGGLAVRFCWRPAVERGGGGISLARP